MDCDDIRQLLEGGEQPAGPEWEAHRSECRACAELLAGDGDLGRLLAGAVTPPRDLDAMVATLTDRVGRERGARAWLRSRPTPARVALGVGAVALISLLVMLFTRRVDMTVYPVLPMTAVLSVFVAAALWAAVASLRPLHRPPLSRSMTAGVLVALLLVPVAVLALPQVHALHPASLAGAGDDFVRRAIACFLFGLEMGIPVLLLLRLVERRAHATLSAASLAAAAAGLTGIIALQLHCPITHPSHLAVGHGTVALALVLVYVGAASVVRRVV